jgi:hypothetical protein
MNTPIQELEILRDQAYSYGVNVQDIESTLAIAFAQGMGGQIQTPLNVYWVILELLDKQRAQLDYLNLLWVRNQQGDLVPLGSLSAPARQDRPGIDQSRQSNHLGDNLLQSEVGISCGHRHGCASGGGKGNPSAFGCGSAGGIERPIYRDSQGHGSPSPHRHLRHVYHSRYLVRKLHPSHYRALDPSGGESWRTGDFAAFRHAA